MSNYSIIQQNNLSNMRLKYSYFLTKKIKSFYYSKPFFKDLETVLHDEGK